MKTINLEEYWILFNQTFCTSEDSGKILFGQLFNSPLYITDKEIEKKALDLKFPKSMIDLYNDTDGFEHGWHATNNKNITGNMHFLKMKHVLQDWKKIELYTEKDLLENEWLEYYKPFDMISETYSCGILITPDFMGKSIHCHNTPEPELYDLDIDFDGYMIMAIEARIFQYWPKELLDIKAGEESPETTILKKEMPKIFTDFDWKNFVEKYESLRLPKQD